MINMKAMVATIVAVACVVFAQTAHGGVVTPAQEDLAVADVTALMAANIETTAEMVRLAFHDAVGVSPDGHKSDGCINLDNAENKGLITIVEALEELYTDRQADLEYGQMSRADFWALAGATAATQAAGRSTCDGLGTGNNADCLPTLPLVYGRVDCDTAPSTTQIGSFPNAEGGMSTVMTLFQTEMGLSIREVVALMGAHALGDATAADSGGFRGPWVPEGASMILDNEFFVVLSGRTWVQDAKQVPDEPGQTVQQWDSSNTPDPGQIMMLNTDAALYKQVDPDANGVSACATNLQTCPDASYNGTDTNAIVAQYASSNVAFATDFGPAFSKLYSMGYSISSLSVAGETVNNTVTPVDVNNSTSTVSAASITTIAKPLTLLPLLTLFFTSFF